MGSLLCYTRIRNQDTDRKLFWVSDGGWILPTQKGKETRVNSVFCCHFYSSYLSDSVGTGDPTGGWVGVQNPDDPVVMRRTALLSLYGKPTLQDDLWFVFPVLHPFLLSTL